jgi:cysteine synthase B
VAGLGTSGTFVGTTRRLRELQPALTAISVQPDGPFHGLEGLKHMETAIVPGIYDPTIADLDLGVSTDDAYAMTRRLAREEGLLVGISAGANLAAALLALQADRPSRRAAHAVVVVIFPDGGERYLSEAFWTEAE